MNLEIKLSALSAFSTLLAVVVALGLGIIPPLLKRKMEETLAAQRSYNLLQTIQLVLKKYRYYNIQKVIQDGFTQYQYDVNNVKNITININLYQETVNLNHLSENLNLSIKKQVTETLDLLVAISSGFPFNEEEWDRLELLIEKSILDLEKKYDFGR